MNEAIRLAIISGSKEVRKVVQDNLLKFGGLEIVYSEASLSTHFKKLLCSQPDIIFLVTGSPNTFYYEIDPEFKKIASKLPDTKVVIRTELERLHPFVKTCIAAGANIVDERKDWRGISDILRRVQEGEQVVSYESRSGDIGNSYPRHRER